MESPPVLVIEDDPDIREILVQGLLREQFPVLAAGDGPEGWTSFQAHSPGLVILDLMLPGMGGEEVLRRIRQVSTVPVLILSAKDQSLDKILTLGLGADDYVTKPFQLAEVVARVKAQLRRYLQFPAPASSADEVIPWGEVLSLNLRDYSLPPRGEPIPLTAKEFSLLKFFMTHPGQVFTKEQLTAAAWEETRFLDENTLAVHIRRLREKVEENPSNPEWIKTVWGIGYKMEAP